MVMNCVMEVVMVGAVMISGVVVLAVVRMAGLGYGILVVVVVGCVMEVKVVMVVEAEVVGWW